MSIKNLLNNIFKKKPEYSFINFSEHKFSECYKNFDHYQFFLFCGGRVAGKTQAAIRTVLEKLKTPGFRAVVIHISNISYYRLLIEDLLRVANFRYVMTPNTIKNARNNSELKLDGVMRFLNTYTDQDLLIIEDAERLNNEDVKQIVDHADKHIQSVIFCVGDLYSETPVYKFFQRSKNLLGLCMESDYRENKYIPEYVLQQAELMKRRIPKAYYPIWLGMPYKSEENKQ